MFLKENLFQFKGPFNASSEEHKCVVCFEYSTALNLSCALSSTHKHPWSQGQSSYTHLWTTLKSTENLYEVSAYRDAERFTPIKHHRPCGWVDHTQRSMNYRLPRAFPLGDLYVWQLCVHRRWLMREKYIFFPFCLKRLSAGQLPYSTTTPLYTIMSPQKNMHTEWPSATDQSKDWSRMYMKAKYTWRQWCVCVWLAGWIRAMRAEKHSADLDTTLNERVLRGSKVISQFWDPISLFSDRKTTYTGLFTH